MKLISMVLHNLDTRRSSVKLRPPASWHRYAVGIAAAIGCLLLSSPALAQLAPATGIGSTSRDSDTGFAGSVNSVGGYAASVPIDLPTSRGGLPVPVQVVSGGNWVGAVGRGWDVPISYIYHDTTMAHQRPVPQSAFTPDASTPLVTYDRLVLVLDGSSTPLILNAAGTALVARRGNAELDVHQVDSETYVMYDGAGRTYSFSSVESPNRHLVGGNLYLLRSIAGAGSNVVTLTYDITEPTLPGGGTGQAINLTQVSYNAHPTTQGCFKNWISLGYDAAASAPLALPVMGSTVLPRYQKLTTITVNATSDCSSQGVALRTYYFIYQPDADTGSPRLSSVTMTGRQGTPEASVTLPVATYSYGAVHSSGAASITYGLTSPSPIKFTSMIGASMAALNSDSTETVTESTDLLDLNGDGRPDLLDVLDVVTDFSGPGPNATTVFSASLSATATLNLTPKTVISPVGPMYVNVPKTNDVLSEYIDINGDGRMDFIDASGSPDTWTLYLNTPDPSNPALPSWKTFSLPTARIRQALQHQGFTDLDAHTPLARRRTLPGTIYNHCFGWDSTDNRWVPESAGWAEDRAVIELDESFGMSFCDGLDNLQHDDPSLPNYGGASSPEETITEWELKDINGDGYPDFIYNTQQASIVADSLVPPVGQGEDGFDSLEMSSFTAHIYGGSDAMAMMNTAGVHLGAGVTLFASPISLFDNSDACGIEHWEAPLGATSPSVMNLICGFQDVNGDGILDRITTTTQSDGTQLTTAMLGSADPSTSLFSSGVTIPLPGPLARTEVDLTQTGANDFTPTSCKTAANFETRTMRGLRDMNGDGIADYISVDSATGFSVAFGTGAGYSTPIPVSGPTGLQLSRVSNVCAAPTSSQPVRMSTEVSGLHDIDGDGQPEVVIENASTGTLDVYQLSSSVQQTKVGPTSGVPQAGRLTSILNGYGGGVSIEYKSAKQDTLTPHLIPSPEMVVGAVTTSDGNTSATTLFAYGNASQIFDSTSDRFAFPGYGRSVGLRQTVFDTPTASVATLTDTYGLTPFDPSMDATARFKRYLKVGRSSDISQLQGSFTDPWALLSTDVTHSTSRFMGQHLDWNARLLQPGTAPAGNEVCLDMVDPYDFGTSQTDDLGLDQCAARGFLFQTSTIAWRGVAPDGVLVPTAGSSTLVTDTEVTSVDELGRVTGVSSLNDTAVADDDVCITVDYAAPNDSGAHMLNATASRTTNNCAKTPTTLAHETWEYDHLSSGVSTGFVTGYTVSRLDGTGQPIVSAAGSSEIRMFDVTYDPMNMGNPTVVTKVRDDGATLQQIIAYDAFNLRAVSITMDAMSVAVDATPTPPTTITITPDPVTLDALDVTDANGTKRSATYDGENGHARRGVAGSS